MNGSKSTRRNRATAGLVASGALAALVVLPANAAQAADGSVSVLHGIPGLTVDVYVNGDLTIDDFKPGTLEGPLSLPADTYEVEITDKDDKSTVLLGPADVTVESGGNYTIVAHLDAAGDPTVTPFSNDVSTIAAGEARVTARHVAAAPKVDIEANGDVLAPGLVNGDEAVAEVPAGSYDVGIVPSSGGQAVWSENVDLAEGVNTIAYAWGSVEDGTFDVAVQTIDGLHSAPAGVDAGEAGLASATDAGVSNGVVLAFVGLIASLLVAAVSGARLIRARR